MKAALKAIMRILPLGLLLFILCSTVSAQPIFIPFKGEREILKIEDIKNIDIAKMGKRCGNYFLYERIADQRVISFEAPNRPEDRPGTISFVRIVIENVMVK